MGEVKAPDTIYLQWDEEYQFEDEGVTWCKDSINDTDVGYIRAELVENMQMKNKELKAALRGLMKGVQGLPPLTAIQGALKEEYKIAEQVLKETV